jgi:hypothetical protein
MEPTVSYIIAAIGLVLTILNIIDKFIVMKQRADKPQEELEKRVEALERWRELAIMRLDEGSKHFSRIDESTKITQRALLALMDNELTQDGNKDELQVVRNELYNYLFGK